MDGVDFVNFCFGELDKRPRVSKAALVLRPVAGVRVFDKIDPVRGDTVVEQVERCQQMIHAVASVVYDDIDNGIFLSD